MSERRGFPIHRDDIHVSLISYFSNFQLNPQSAFCFSRINYIKIVHNLKSLPIGRLLSSERRGSNSRHPPWQGGALPAELLSQFKKTFHNFSKESSSFVKLTRFPDKPERHPPWSRFFGSALPAELLSHEIGAQNYSFKAHLSIGFWQEFKLSFLTV